jgi:hypothetical protein
MYQEGNKFYLRLIITLKKSRWATLATNHFLATSEESAIDMP